MPIGNKQNQNCGQRKRKSIARCSDGNGDTDRTNRAFMDLTEGQSRLDFWLLSRNWRAQQTSLPASNMVHGHEAGQADKVAEQIVANGGNATAVHGSLTSRKASSQ